MPEASKSDSAPLNHGDATEYLSFLSQAAERLSSSKDLVATIQSVATIMVPKISDWCAVDIASKDGKLERMATAHVNPHKVEKALELGRKYPRDPNADSGSSYVLRTGTPNMHNAITDDLLVAAAINDEHLAMMRDLQFYSLMIVPIKSRARTIGTISFVWAESAKTYSLADLAFAEILANMAGSAIDNSQLQHLAAKTGRNQ